MDAAETLLIPLMQAFLWFDDGMQSCLQAKGWDKVTRPQSMVMAHVMIGVTRPSDIARNLGMSRQAVHTTIAQMVAMDMVQLAVDPKDARMKTVVASGKGLKMSEDAASSVAAIIAELERRIGRKNVENMIAAFGADWGPPPTEWARSRQARLSGPLP